MIQNSKPDPEIYYKASAILEAEPDEETLDFIVGKYNDLEEVKNAFENGELRI